MSAKASDVMMSSRGFTLVELVVVIVLLGIMAAVAIPRMTGLGEYRALEFRDRTVAALRYAQKTATSHRRRVCVAFTADSMTLTIASASGAVGCDTNLNLPGAAVNVLASPDPADAFFTGGNVAFAFLPDGTGADRTISIVGQDNITVVEATGLVR